MRLERHVAGMVNTRKSRLKADLTLLFVAVIWGSAFVAQRVAALNNSVFLYNGLRFILAALLLFVFLKSARSIDLASIKLSLVAGIILFLASSFQQIGLLYTTAGNAGFITSLYVVIVPVYLFVGWREKIRPVYWLAVIVAGLGAYMLSTTGSLNLMGGDALELVGAGFWAAHVIFIGKYGVRVTPVSFAAIQFLVCGILSVFSGVLFEQQWLPGLQPVIWSVIYTGVFSIGIGYTLQIVAQRQTPPTDAALILSLESVMAVFWGWLLLGEVFSLLQLIGCVLIFLAVILVQLRVTEP